MRTKVSRSIGMLVATLAVLVGNHVEAIDLTRSIDRAIENGIKEGPFGFDLSSYESQARERAKQAGLASHQIEAVVHAALSGAEKTLRDFFRSSLNQRYSMLEQSEVPLEIQKLRALPHIEPVLEFYREREEDSLEDVVVVSVRGRSENLAEFIPPRFLELFSQVPLPFRLPNGPEGQLHVDIKQAIRHPEQVMESLHRKWVGAPFLLILNRAPE